MVNYENRWGRDRTHDLQYIFFNGVGYNAWENIWGIWNQFTPRDAEALRRIATMYRQFAPLMVSMDWRPYAPTLQVGVFASHFPVGGLQLWTVVNRNEYAMDGEQLAVRACRRHALLRRVERRGAAAARIDGDARHPEFHAGRRAASARCWRSPQGTVIDGLDVYLATAREHAENAARLAQQRMEVAAAATGGDRADRAGSHRAGRHGRRFPPASSISSSTASRSKATCGKAWTCSTRGKTAPAASIASA